MQLSSHVTSRPWVLAAAWLSFSSCGVCHSQTTPNALSSSALPKTAAALVGEKFVPSTLAGTPGFFRVGLSTTGHWWFQDPEGKPFFFRGVTSVNRGDDLVHPGPYTKKVLDEYGQDPAVFRKATFERLHEWGFNALGAWSNKELWDQGFPFTVILNFTQGGPQIEGTYLPDVFDPMWLEGIDKIAEELAARERNSKLLVGYFTDNELGWAQALADERQLTTEKLDPNHSPSLLQLCLSQQAGKPAYEAAWSFVLGRHKGSLSELAADWMVQIDSRETVSGWSKAKIAIRSVGYLRDDADYSRMFARRYFEATSEAIRRHDPNHLNLGCRFGGPPGDAVLSQMRPWVDVVSANNYRYEMQARMNIYYRATGLPVLNTEFSWGHAVFADRPLPDQAPAGVSDVDRMIGNGRAALEESFKLPGLIGWTWYRWVDKPEFAPPITFGLVNLENEPNTVSTELAKRINACAEKIAVSGSCALGDRKFGVNPLDDRNSDGVAAAQGGAPVLPGLRPDPEGFQERRGLLLGSLSSEDATYFETVKPVPDPNKFALPTMLSKLSERTDRQAVFAYLARHTDETYHFSVAGLARLIPMFGNELPAETRKRLESSIAANSDWTAQGTENHKLMWLTSGVVLSSQLPELSFYGGASEWRRKQLLEPLRLYVKRLYAVGQGEWDSSTYETFSAQGFLNLYDFSTDPYTKAVAAAALDWYSAAIALKYFHGTLAGPERRGFDRGTLLSDTALSGWLWWGDSSRKATLADFTGPKALAGRYSVHAALSTYRPHPALLELARKRLPIQGHETKPTYGMEQPAESYGTFSSSADYFLGSVESGAGGVVPGENQMSPWKLVARASGGNYVFTSLNPFYEPDEGRSPYDQVAQHGDSLIQMTYIPAGAEGAIARVQEEISHRPSGDDRFLGRVVREARFRVPEKLEVGEERGWFFIAANDTWIAVRPLQTGAKLEERSGSSEAQYIVCSGDTTGFLVQVADRSRYPSLKQFQETVLAKVAVDLSQIGEGHVAWTSLDGAKLNFKFNRGGTWPSFMVNGVAEPTDLAKVYDTPAIQQEGSRLTVRDSEGNGYQWDFTGDWPYYTELGGATRHAK